MMTLCASLRGTITVLSRYAALIAAVLAAVAIAGVAGENGADAPPSPRGTQLRLPSGVVIDVATYDSSREGYDLRKLDEPGARRDGDAGPAQRFELVRPGGVAVRLGRLTTSCGCIRLEAEKTGYADGERCLLDLRNVRPTPPGGHPYEIYAELLVPAQMILHKYVIVISDPDQPQAADAARENAPPAE